MFLRLPARATFVADTNFVSGPQKCFWFCSETFCVRNKCFPVCAAQEISWATMCPQQCVLVYQGLKCITRKTAYWTSNWCDFREIEVRIQSLLLPGLLLSNSSVCSSTYQHKSSCSFTIHFKHINRGITCPSTLFVHFLVWKLPLRTIISIKM